MSSVQRFTEAARAARSLAKLTANFISSLRDAAHQAHEYIISFNERDLIKCIGLREIEQDREAIRLFLDAQPQLCSAKSFLEQIGRVTQFAEMVLTYARKEGFESLGAFHRVCALNNVLVSELQRTSSWLAQLADRIEQSADDSNTRHETISNAELASYPSALALLDWLYEQGGGPIPLDDVPANLKSNDILELCQTKRWIRVGGPLEFLNERVPDDRTRKDTVIEIQLKKKGKEAVLECRLMAKAEIPIDHSVPKSAPTSLAAEPRRRISREEANMRARELLNKNRTITLRELADKIPCSTGLVAQLPAWMAVQEERKKGRKPKKPKVIGLTRTERTDDPLLEELIADQARDFEPSPIEDDPPDTAPTKVKIRRKL